MLNVVQLQVQSFKEKIVLPSCSLNKSCRKQLWNHEIFTRRIFWAKSFKVLLAVISRETKTCKKKSTLYMGKERGNRDTISNALKMWYFLAMKQYSYMYKQQQQQQQETVIPTIIMSFGYCCKSSYHRIIFTNYR